MRSWVLVLVACSGGGDDRFDAAVYALAFGRVGWLLLQDDPLGTGELVPADWAAGMPLGGL